MPKRKPKKQANFKLNALVTLRAQTIPDKRKQASKRACRGQKAGHE